MQLILTETDPKKFSLEMFKKYLSKAKCFQTSKTLFLITKPLKTESIQLMDQVNN